MRARVVFDGVEKDQLWLIVHSVASLTGQTCIVGADGPYKCRVETAVFSHNVEYPLSRLAEDIEAGTVVMPHG